MLRKSRTFDESHTFRRKDGETQRRIGYSVSSQGEVLHTGLKTSS